MGKFLTCSDCGDEYFWDREDDHKCKTPKPTPEPVSDVDELKLNLSMSVDESLEFLSKLELNNMDSFTMCSALKTFRSQKAEIEGLRELVDSHGRHHDDCDVVKQKFMQTRCDCGFTKALETIKKVKGE